MVYNVFYEGIRTLIQNGLVEMLVFALIFALVYGILENVHLFGKPKDGDDKAAAKKALNKKLHAVVALVLSILSIIPHYVSSYSRYDIIPIITGFLPEISIGILLILCALILLGMFGISLKPSDGNPLMFGIFIVVIAYVLWVVGDLTRWWNLPRWMNYEMVSVIVAILVFVGVVKFVMGPEDKKAKGAEISKAIKDGDWKKVKMTDALSNMFGGHQK